MSDIKRYIVSTKQFDELPLVDILSLLQSKGFDLNKEIVSTANIGFVEYIQYPNAKSVDYTMYMPTRHSVPTKEEEPCRKQSLLQRVMMMLKKK